MTHLGLFEGIGGFALAAGRCGFVPAGFVEKSKFCQKVLSKHWPDVPIYDDVCTFSGIEFEGTTLVTGGFPCQDISVANPLGKGIDGSQSGLVFEALRIISEIGPHWVVLENVYQLLHRGGERVCSELEAIGYEVWPLMVCAGSAGAPDMRKRWFLVGHSKSVAGLQADSCEMPQRSLSWTRGTTGSANRNEKPGTYWNVHQPPVVGVVDGIPDRVDRVTALGNAVNPYQVYPILEAIADYIRG